MDTEKAFAYLYFRALDITTDVVSKADMSSAAKAAALESISSEAACRDVKREYDCMVAAIMAQRKAHAADPVWRPDATDIWRVVQDHAAIRARAPLTRIAIGLAILAIAGALWWRARR